MASREYDERDRPQRPGRWDEPSPPQGRSQGQGSWGGGHREGEPDPPGHGRPGEFTGPAGATGYGVGAAGGVVGGEPHGYGRLGDPGRRESAGEFSGRGAGAPPGWSASQAGQHAGWGTPQGAGVAAGAYGGGPGAAYGSGQQPAGSWGGPSVPPSGQVWGGTPSAPGQPGAYGPAHGGPAPGYLHDHDYHQWREEQLRNLDKDYETWRQDRYRKFSEEFNSWRAARQQGTTPASGGSSEGRSGSPAPGASADTGSNAAANPTDASSPSSKSR